MKVPAFVISLDRTPERWKHMCKAFPNTELTRVAATDGNEWVDHSSLTENGRVRWREDKRELMEELRVLAPRSEILWEPNPGEVGCIFSHTRVWSQIVRDQIPWAIVMEDDVQPVEGFDGDFWGAVCQSVRRHPELEALIFTGHETRAEVPLDEEERVTGGFGNSAYALSFLGAIRSLQACIPAYLPIDIQWRMVGFRAYSEVNQLPHIQTHRLHAFGLSTPVIRRADIDVFTTLSPTGEKTWQRDY